jgi:hypothetical protein
MSKFVGWMSGYIAMEHHKPGELWYDRDMEAAYRAGQAEMRERAARVWAGSMNGIPTNLIRALPLEGDRNPDHSGIPPEASLGAYLDLIEGPWHWTSRR